MIIHKILLQKSTKINSKQTFVSKQQYSMIEHIKRLISQKRILNDWFVKRAVSFWHKTLILLVAGSKTKGDLVWAWCMWKKIYAATVFLYCLLVKTKNFRLQQQADLSTQNCLDPSSFFSPSSSLFFPSYAIAINKNWVCGHNNNSFIDFIFKTFDQFCRLFCSNELIGCAHDAQNNDVSRWWWWEIGKPDVLLLNVWKRRVSLRPIFHNDRLFLHVRQRCFGWMSSATVQMCCWPIVVDSNRRQ